jgi:hypothetical protein
LKLVEPIPLFSSPTFTAQESGQEISIIFRQEENISQPSLGSITNASDICSPSFPGFFFSIQLVPISDENC